MSDPTAGLRIRTAVRAVLLDPTIASCWCASTSRAVRSAGRCPAVASSRARRSPRRCDRELIEEVGLHHPDIGPLVWIRTHVIPLIGGQFDGQRDHIHLVRTMAFEPRPMLTWEQLNAEFVFDMRWWTLDEICAAADVSFVPAALPDVLAALLTDGPPASPLDVGV